MLDRNEGKAFLSAAKSLATVTLADKICCSALL